MTKTPKSFPDGVTPTDARCAWCDEIIPDDHDRAVLIRGGPVYGHGSFLDYTVLAAFHDDDGMPCYGEARAHGWE